MKLFLRKIFFPKRRSGQLVLVFVGIGIIAALAVVIPKVFATASLSLTKTTVTDFDQGTKTDTAAFGEGDGGGVRLARDPASNNPSYQADVSDTSGLVSYWKMDEDSGRTLKDSKGSSDGTLQSEAVQWVAGKMGNALSFDGLNSQYVQVPPFSDGWWLNGVSVEAWVYFNGSDSSGTILDVGLRLFIDSDGKINLENGRGHILLTSDSSLETGRWYHIVGTVGPGTMPRKIYINSALDASDAGSVENIGNAAFQDIGNNATYFDQPLNGKIDELRVYAGALSQADVDDLYNSGDGTETPAADLEAGWHFNESSESTAADYSGNNYDGTLYPAGFSRWISGKYNNGLQFAYASNQYALVDNQFDWSGDFSLEWWIKGSTPRTNFDVMIGLGSYYYFSRAYNPGDGTYNLSFYGTGQNDVINSTDLSDNQWHNVAIVKTGTGTHIRAYIDGILESTVDNAYSLTSTDLYFGKFAGFETSYFNGKLDDVAFYNRVLSQEEIVDHLHGDYKASGNWESPSDANAINLYYIQGWGDGTPDSTAFTAHISGASADRPVVLKMRAASSADALADADYKTLGTVTENGAYSKTKSDFDALGLDGNPENIFIQVKAEFATNDISRSPSLDDFSLNYLGDDTLPESSGSEIGMKVDPDSEALIATAADGIKWTSWTQNLGDGYAPNFVWNNGNDGQSGIKGYCLYVGTDSEGDPVSDSGKLNTDNSVLAAGSACKFAVPADSGEKTTFQSSARGYLHPASWDPNQMTDSADDHYFWTQPLYSSWGPYYINIKAIDNAGNVSDAVAQLKFAYDDGSPSDALYVSLPEHFVSDPAVTMTWPVEGNDAATDQGNCEDGITCASGVGGYQYNIDGGTWYGVEHNGNQDLTDIIPADQGAYTFGDADLPLLTDGIHAIRLRTIDKAGNPSGGSLSGTLKIDTTSPSEPLNLAVTPSEPSETNSYAFSWNPPAARAGLASNITYCYTVNTLPSAFSCAWTGAGVTSLAADAFANQPGENIFYVVARSENNAINYSNYASVIFNYSGSAPGIPRGIDIADVSIKTTANWKVAVSWEAPENVGAGVDTYKIYRSASEGTCADNDHSFDQIASSAGTSYVDAGLEQKTYYYCVKACDSANSCSAYSSTVSKYPTGKFIEPADMVSGPDVSGITTKRAEIKWSTDRGSDSRIAFGTKSGEYNEEEISNSDQVTDHDINLTNLEPGTTYYYRAKWTDEDGNIGNSSEKSFKTDPAPSVKDVKARDINLSGAMIDFTSKGADKVKIYYGKSTDFGGSKEITTASSEAKYSAEITGLEDGTKYYYRINSFDVEGDEYEGTILDFTTLPRPKISNVKVQQVMDTAQPTVLVSWDTNTEISSIISYYPENNAGEKHDEIKADLISGEHKMLLKGLFADTPYTMVVKGVDKVGNEAVSDSQKFTTASDTRPPAITDLNVEGSNTSLVNGSSDQQNISQLVVSWNTDEPAASQVEFGEGAGNTYPQKTQEDANLTYNHLVVISGLTPSKVYHLRAVSTDKAGNASDSVDMVAITPKESESALDLVVTNLQQIFGFLNSN